MFYTLQNNVITFCLIQAVHSVTQRVEIVAEEDKKQRVSHSNTFTVF